MLHMLSDMHETLRQTAREVALRSVEPRAAEIDSTDEYPYDLLKLFVDLGLMGVGVPEEYGGVGAGVLGASLVIEEIARVSASASMILAVQELGLLPILLGGTAEQKQRLVPPLASGERTVSFALTEPEAGSDAASLKTMAERSASQFILNGSKRFITQGGVSDWYVVFATMDPAKRAGGISCFLVEKETPGLSFPRHEKKMGLRGSPTAELFLDNCRIPAENLIGTEGEGFNYAMLTLDHTRTTVGAQALGIAQGALDHAVKYAGQRRQFGRPIGQFQGMQFMLADMAMKVEAARALCYKTAAMIDLHEPHVRAGRRFPEEVLRFSAMTKCFCSDAAMAVTTDAVQVLGGYGYTTEFPVERMMRDAKITQIYEGTNQILRTVIGRSLVGV